MKTEKKEKKAVERSPGPGTRPADVVAAEGFSANPFYERLLELRETKPAAYATLSQATRLAVEAYVKVRRSAAPAAPAEAAA